ncbi:MAG: hypothetical protein WCA44_07730 [Acidobacteriaceae bacterium]
MAMRKASLGADLLFPFTHWNWKVSLLTALLRGLACVGILRHLAPSARWHFGLVEAAFVLLTCGFFSALQQQTLQISREALAWLACVVAAPLASLACDAGLHFWLDGRDTCRLGVAALVFTVVANTLHWHMIRNGALLVGDEAHSFGADLKRIPSLMGTYCAAPVLWIGRIAGSAMRRPEAEEGAAA